MTRPFYPARPGPRGSVKRDDLPAALGLESYDVLQRLCDRGHPDRSAAVLFWTLGGNQVGKAAISGWRDVIAPVTQQFADHGQALAERQRAGSERVTEVVNAYMVESGASPDTPPGVLQVGEV